MTGSNSNSPSPQAIKETFLSLLPEIVAQIEGLWQKLKEENWSIETARRFQETAHKLSGISLSVGYTNIGLAARALENSLRDVSILGILDKEKSRALLNLLEQYLEALRQAIKAEQVDGFIEDSLPQVIQSLHDTRSGRLIYLVEDDPLQAEQLASQIGYFGYTVKIFTKLDELQNNVKQDRPDAVLMDIIFPEGDLAGTETIMTMRRYLAGPLPVIFFTARNDLPARLQAVRAGGAAYFTKPVNIGKLIDELDRMLTDDGPIPYRVLIVDDVAVEANINAAHLQRAGMETAIVTDPMKVVDKLIDFYPEIILLDVHMPGCTGLELAKVIRQIDAFIHIPIVYLSAETDRTKQLQAIRLGGDDFLTKPINPQYLASAVSSRVERYRQLRALMERDGLTGLLNHSSSKERLNQELSRSRRHNAPLAFAMLDIDNFKTVNDSYGHATGDRVLKSLAHMLVNRLRVSDIVGRYGGEEFSVIFPNTTVQEAFKIMEEVRESFSMVNHRAAEKDFSITFSCGVAAFPDFTTPGNIGEAADKALYIAKNEGRNRTVSATP
ncbi:MAG: diguanylate cyclase [Deltaproteobacteria bacterium]|nr:diguanylate cyclase [Deltaproteobacteria bacterium]